MRPSDGIPCTSISSTSAASGGVLLRHEQAQVAAAPSAGRGRERAAHRPQLAAERELAAERARAERFLRHLPAGRQHADGDRQVEARARLAHVRGREVHRDALLREVEPGVQQRRADPLARLADGAVRQPDERERREPAADVDLDGDLVAARRPRGRTWRRWRACGGHARRLRVTRGRANVTLWLLVTSGRGRTPATEVAMADDDGPRSTRTRYDTSHRTESGRRDDVGAKRATRAS